MRNLQQLLNDSPPIDEAYDTSTKEFEKYRILVNDWFENQENDYLSIDYATNKSQKTIGFRIALKLAQSKKILTKVDKNVTITLLNPVYKESGRIQRRSEHPHGEDSIRFKIKELRSIESLNSCLNMRFVVIDDECPDGSGEMAREILKNEFPDEFNSGKYNVLFLSDAIDNKDPELPVGLTHKSGTNRSVKGGALLYGMYREVDQQKEGTHILIDNDADLSIHTGQIGILVEEILSGVTSIAAGSRREENSVSLIGGERNIRGQLFIKIWKYFLPQLSERITDTNRAFKAFDTTALREILYRVKIYTFPYQIEILQAAISAGIPLNKIGIAYIDSEAASTQSGDAITETYLNQINQIIDIALRYQTMDKTDPLLLFFQEIDESEWSKIENNPPDNLAELLS